MRANKKSSFVLDKELKILQRLCNCAGAMWGQVLLVLGLLLVSFSSVECSCYNNCNRQGNVARHPSVLALMASRVMIAAGVPARRARLLASFRMRRTLPTRMLSAVVEDIVIMSLVFVNAMLDTAAHRVRVWSA